MCLVNIITKDENVLKDRFTSDHQTLCCLFLVLFFFSIYNPDVHLCFKQRSNLLQSFLFLSLTLTLTHTHTHTHTHASKIMTMLGFNQLRFFYWFQLYHIVVLNRYFNRYSIDFLYQSSEEPEKYDSKRSFFADWIVCYYVFLLPIFMFVFRPTIRLFTVYF